jgi:hypothetical protein
MCGEGGADMDADVRAQEGTTGKEKEKEKEKTGPKGR